MPSEQLPTSGHDKREPSSFDQLIELGRIRSERPEGLTVGQTLAILGGNNSRRQLEATVSTDRSDGFNETSGEQSVAAGKVPEAVVGVDSIGEQPPVLIVDEETDPEPATGRGSDPTTGRHHESEWGG